MNLKFLKLTEPTAEVAECFSKWENDPTLIHLIRPNKDESALEVRQPVTAQDIEERLAHHQIYLIYLDEQLIGEMDFQVDPRHLFRKEEGSGWIGIVIGEERGRGKGVGLLALQYLEYEMQQQGLRRIELGVFEFNTNAIKLYQKAAYKEIVRIPDFTYWQGQLWHDIRMEKYL